VDIQPRHGLKITPLSRFSFTRYGMAVYFMPIRLVDKARSARGAGVVAGLTEPGTPPDRVRWTRLQRPHVARMSINRIGMVSLVRNWSCRRST